MMKTSRSIRYSRGALVLINLLAITYTAGLYLYTSQYIIAKGASHQLLEHLASLPSKPSQLFIMALVLYGLLLVLMAYRSRHPEQFSIYDTISVVELLLTVWILSVLHFSYNGLILLVFTDIFYGSQEFHSKRDKFYWLGFIGLSFGMLLLSDYGILSLFWDLPSLNAYIAFYPSSTQIFILFFKNFLTSLNIVVFIASLLFYLMQTITERHHIEEELRMAAQANTELNNYLALSEKIAEDRERKRIAREIHDTLGHALTGISAGIDAVQVLVDIDASRAKEQLKAISGVVREGIRDVRGSLQKLRPGALENHSLKEALLKIIEEYQTVSHLSIHFSYEWEGVDLDIMQEDVIFRVIQESLTNSVRHGHASEIWIRCLVEEGIILTLQDNGVGFEQLNYGFGLKQMRERLTIIGGRVTFENRNGFYTRIELPLNGKEKQ